MNRLFLTIISIIAMLSGCGRPAATSVSSPNGKISLDFHVNKDGAMLYEVQVNNKPFILPSRLGFEEQTGMALATLFDVMEVEFAKEDETWTQPWGENKTIRNRYNEMVVHLTNIDANLTMRFRLFDDGLGFRYEYGYATDGSTLLLTDELTEFNFAQNGVSWSIAADFDTYELPYRTLPIDQVEDANTPITMKTEDGVYASIHEAALVDFPEMTLVKKGNMGFKSNLAHWPDGVKVRIEGGTFVTPWRTIQIANEAVGLINSALILNLNEPCAIEGDLSWIRPMKYVGIWWGMHLGIESWVMGDRHGATTQNVKKYIDFAAANNIDAVLAEGWNQGWEGWGDPSQVPFSYTKPYADFDMEELARYAAEKGVELIGHHETSGHIDNYEQQMEEAFAWSKSLGINSIKTGYAGGITGGQQHHNQFMVRHYRKVVERAAAHRLSINAHEPIKPTGIRRTYPNMMSAEGARGMEWNAWSEGNPPHHHVLLPFTRLLAGPMDYTPGVFDILFEKTRNLPQRKKWNPQDKGNSRVNTTLAKQVANWVVLYSPVQMASDLVEHYEGHPCFQFFRDFDPDCDWSEALQGEPGEFIAVVRRAKNKFFLGATTNHEARTLTIPLNFLKEGVAYKAIVYADGDNADWETNPLEYRIVEMLVASTDTLSVEMAKGGGQAVSFVPVE